MDVYVVMDYDALVSVHKSKKEAKIESKKLNWGRVIKMRLRK